MTAKSLNIVTTVERQKLFMTAKGNLIMDMTSQHSDNCRKIKMIYYKLIIIKVTHPWT